MQPGELLGMKLTLKDHDANQVTNCNSMAFKGNNLKSKSNIHDSDFQKF